MNIEEINMTSVQREKILKDIWIAHDGRWFLKCASELGFDVATRLNLLVTKSFGKTEVKRLRHEVGIIEIKNIHDLEEFMITASDIYCPEEHKYTFSVIDNDTLSVKILQCYVYKNVSLAGTTEIHQCAGVQRFKSWLEALDLKGSVINSSNTNNCSGKCEFIFKIEW